MSDVRSQMNQLEPNFRMTRICKITGKIIFGKYHREWGVEFQKIEKKYDARMFKWHVRNSKALLHMTRIYILLFLPAGSPFTEVPEKFEQRLKLEGVSLDARTFKASDRDELLQKIPAFCFNARYHLSKNYLIL